MTNKSPMQNRYVRHLFMLFFFTLICFLVYANSFRGVFVFDDWVDIVDNTHIHSLKNWTNLIQVYPSRWLVYLTFAINYYFHGTEVFGYHLVNVGIHIFATFLCYLIAGLLFDIQHYDNAQRKKKDIFAFSCALLFLVHPLQTHAVTYIVQRLALMMSLFYLTGIYAYLRMRVPDKVTGVYKKSHKWTVLFFLSILGGIFSKENFFSFPLMLIVIEYCFFDLFSSWKEKCQNRRLLLTILSGFCLWLILTLAWFLLKFDMQTFKGLMIERYYDTGEYVNTYTYFLTQFRVFLTYIRLFFLPFGQNADYAYAVSHSIFEHHTWVYMLIVGFMVSGAIYLKKKLPLVSFGILFFFVALSVESSILPTLNLINEYRMYVPLFGLLIAVIGFVLVVLPYAKIHIFKIIIVLLVLVCSFLTFKRNMIYSSEVAFWSDIIGKSPTKARAFNGRGVAFMRAGNEELAINDFKKALELRPGYQTVLFNLGKFWMFRQEYAPALEYFIAAARADHIEIPPAHISMTIGILFLKQNELDTASRYFDHALQSDPELYYAHYYRAVIFAREKKYENAIKHMDHVLNYVDNFEYMNLRGVYHYKAEQYELALADFQDALSMCPNDSAIYCNISDVYLKKNEYAEALAHINAAIKVDPSFAEAYYKRAQIWRMHDNPKMADKDMQKANELGYESEFE